MMAMLGRGAVSLENQCYRRGRRQSKIMKLEPRAQSSEVSEFIRTTYAEPHFTAFTPKSHGFIERLEPVNGVSAGKEFEPILIALSSELLPELSTKIHERCLIIGIEVAGSNLFESFQELCSLTASSGLSVIACESQKSDSPTDDAIFGNGKIKQIANEIITQSIDTVVYDGQLTPVQLRNLEDAILHELPTGQKRVKLLDKTSIILDIMVQNSLSKETALQAELAMATYRLPRMTSMWMKLFKISESHLSIGCRGLGAKNLDFDYKYLRKRISYLKKSIEEVRATKAVQRQCRKSKGLPSIAIVGYVASGKSSLLNALSCIDQSQCKSGDENTPFKTLEAVTRRISVPKQEKLPTSNLNGRAKLSLSRSVCPDFLCIDTMSLIDKLPACVISAFQMNFDELREADVLVNVCDISDPMWHKHERAVLTILSSMDGLADKPMITVWNKLDCFQCRDIPGIRLEASKRHQTVAVSAHTGLGFDEMLRCFNDVMVGSLMSEVRGTLRYTPQNLALLSKLQQISSFDIMEYTNEGVSLMGRIPFKFAAQFADSVIAVKVKAKVAKISLMKAFIF